MHCTAIEPTHLPIFTISVICGLVPTDIVLILVCSLGSARLVTA